MNTGLNVPWPLQAEVEKELLMHCREAVESGVDQVVIHCGLVPHPSTRVLMLLLNIARLAPQGKPQWHVTGTDDNLMEALRLTGLDFWFKSCSDGETLK